MEGRFLLVPCTIRISQMTRITFAELFFLPNMAEKNSFQKQPFGLRLFSHACNYFASSDWFIAVF